MNARKTNSRAAVALALAGAFGIFAVASCSDVYTGGDVDSSSTSFTGSQTTETLARKSAESSEFKAVTEEIEQAAGDSEITVAILTATKLNEESISQAVNFYPLTNNDEDASYYPKRGAALSKSLKETVQTFDDGDSITYATFKVNTGAVTTREIAAVCDATALKGADGRLVLNCNGNLTVGEEGDSAIEYISVAKTADGSDTTELNYKFKESYAPEWTFTEVLDSDSFSAPQNSDGSITVTTASAEYDTDKYLDDLAGKLNSIYSLETKAPGAASFTQDGAFRFSYDSDTHTYTAKTGVLAPGTLYRLKVSPETATESAVSTSLFGHQSLFFKTTEVEYGDEETAEFYQADTTFIVSSSTTEFTAGEVDYDEVTSAQNALLSKSGSNGVYTVTLGSLGGDQLEFDNATDFIVIDYVPSTSNFVKVPATVTKLNSTTVSIQLEKPYYSGKGTLRVYVGSGTTLKSNPVNASQTHFGIYQNPAYGDASGYVRIY